MATPSDAQAVKSLNKSSGRKRFVFKTFSQRIEEIDIDVYRSLDTLQAEPSQGSSFFRDCLIQWRELNTADDFISFYEEMMPLVQTLPQIILHKELILSKLLSRLHMEGRLSLEPVLRLIAALSRDLLEEFLFSLPKVVDTLATLLKCGADREPEIIEQILTSWSHIMMYLQKYLMRDIVYVLKVTVKLRYYEKDYVQEFMAEAVSFLLRNAHDEQLIKGIRKVMFEVVKKPLVMRKSGVSALLRYVMRGTSSTLHSRAKRVLRLLLDNSILSIGDKFTEGPDTIVEVVSAAFQRLCEELEPKELNVIWKCLDEELTDCISQGPSVHLTRLLSLLISTLQIEYLPKFSDLQPVFKLIGKLVHTFIIPDRAVNIEDQPCELVEKVFQLILCVLDANMSELSSVLLQWTRIFESRESSLLSFIRQLLKKDPSILYTFRNNILCALDDFIETSEEEVIYLVLSFYERFQVNVQGSDFVDEKFKGASRIRRFLLGTIDRWIKMICDVTNGNLSSIYYQDANFPMLWGVICCYPYMVDSRENTSLLMDLVEAIDRLLTIESDKMAGSNKRIWQSLIGAAMSSHLKLLGNVTGREEMSKIMHLVRRHKSSSQILATVADFLDSMNGSMLHLDTTGHPELTAEKAIESLDLYAENLCCSDKEIRVSSLRILSHYEPLICEYFTRDQSVEKKFKNDSESVHPDDQGSNVLQLLLSIESTPLSIATSRKVILLISRIQMGLSAERISKYYLNVVLYGIIGILHNRFSYLWDPALGCLSVLISKYSGQVWDIFVQYLEQCQSIFLTSYLQSERDITESSNKHNDMVERFNLFVTPASDSTPCTAILSSLLQCLQKVPTIPESRSRQIIPLFLKFLGYDNNTASQTDQQMIGQNLLNVRSYNSQACRGKEWKGVLKEWLELLKLMRNPKSFHRSQFLKEVLLYRLLDEDDAGIQMKVLDCLLNWRDEFLLPYDLNLRNLISSKKLREELTTWSLSKESKLVEERHRSYIIPLVIQILTPKVRKPKVLASRKHASIHHRKAVIGFLAQLDVEELPLFFALLIKPLLDVPQGAYGIPNWFCSSPESLNHEIETPSILKCFTMNNINALSWKKRCGFLHVIDDIIGVFDEMHIKPYLDLLIGCVVRVLGSCTSNLDDGKNLDSSMAEHSCSDPNLHEEDGGAENQSTTTMALKQFKDLRSLCLKIISLVLNKYEDHDFGCEFWDLFFKSVKRLIDAFKQEGASSEKPSSLFSCFLAMSRSYKLVPLLWRERNLIPDIFSILTVMTASEAIISFALNFIENLLILDSELDSEENSVKGLLLLNLDALVCSLCSRFKCNNSTKRKLAKCPGERELRIFKLLSKYIKDPVAARNFVEIILPLLGKKTQNFDVQVEALQVVRQIIPVSGNEITAKILNAVSPLLISAGPDVRMPVCDLLDALAGNDSSARPLARLIRELNATSVAEMGGLDYDTIISAYEKIDKSFFYSVKEEHVLVILSHAVHDLSSEELILRHSAYRLLLSFVEFSADILAAVEDSGVVYWSKTCTLGIINNFLIRYIGNAMNGETSLLKLWLDLLRDMVLKLPMLPNLSPLGALCCEDAEQDFFYNVVHLQKHRRARAVVRLRNLARSGNLSEGIANKVFVPLLFNMLLEVKDGKGEHVRSACMEALASISGHLEWKSYYALLIRCFHEMALKSDKRKVLLRLICMILDHFHFREAAEGATGGVSKSGIVKTSSSIACTDSATASEIQTCLHKIVLPKIQKLLTSDSDNVNVNISLVALKLLKLLPGDIMELHLPNIIHRISNFLKNRLDSIREEARSALAAALKELGLEYLHFIVKVLKSTLKRGYELHVLGYTLNFILSKCLLNPISGKLDYCLNELLSVAVNDILGDVSEEKDVEKIASKMKETRKRKSFETLKLISQNITFKTHARKLLTPVYAQLQKHLTPKVKSKLETMLSHIASGIEGNPSVNQEDLFNFVYWLIKDAIVNENSKLEMASSGRMELSRKDISSSSMVGSDPQCSHIITVFALNVLHNRMKSMKPDKKDEQLLSMLDPFVGLLGDCLSSKYEDIISAALRCLAPLVRLPLPSLESQGDKIKTSLLDIARGSVNTSSPLMQSCLTLLTVLLKNTRITLSTDQLHILIQFPLFVDLAQNPSFVALSLLKAVVKRTLVVHEIYDVVATVSKLMITSQVEPIRKKCSQILLQFLLDYHLSEKRLQQHLHLLLENLRYEYSTGREAVLEMLHTIIKKFPQNALDVQSQTVFVQLVICLSNDRDNKVRSMAGAAIKFLIESVSPSSRNSILESTLSWYSDGMHRLWSTGAQVLGLLVEVMKVGFQRHVNVVLPVMRSILQSAVTVVADTQLDLSDGAAVPFWKEAYYSLIMFEKIVHQFREMCLERDLEDIWEAICECLLYPHSWLRNISSRLVAFYFATATETSRQNPETPLGTFFLMRPGRIFLIAVSLCCQLKELTDGDAASTLITQNIVFAICGVHSLVEQNEWMHPTMFWSMVEHHEQGLYLKAFQLLDSRKGRSMFSSLTSGIDDQHTKESIENFRYVLVSYLLKKMGKTALQMEAIQMTIVFNCFKSLVTKIVNQKTTDLSQHDNDCQHYVYPMLMPLYKVCEGFVGKVFPDDVKQLGQEVCDHIRNKIGMPTFVQVYSLIRKNLKAKRDKRRQEIKLMAVVNPMRNAKRKLRVAAKNKANKKRKVISMKMGRWMR